MKIYESAGKDLLDRSDLINAYTRLLDLPEGPRVISVEAGYGEGKTVFASLWRDELARGPQNPVLFNAWEADGADDPLMAFMAGLAAAISVPDGKGDTASRGAKFWQAGKALFMTSARTVGRAVLREGIDEFTDGLGEMLKAFDKDLPEGIRDEFATLADFVEAQDGDLDKALVGELAAQFAALRLRNAMRVQTLDTIHHALAGDGEGKIIVLIDELDRCRPDFAVGLLEAIKHLFDHESFRFVLMLNPERLESTAGQLYGRIENGEKYLTKFIDQRLRLPSSDAERHRFISHLAKQDWLGDYESWSGISIIGDDAPINLNEFIREHRFSLREIAHAFDMARLTFALYPEKPVDAGFLISLALCLHRPLTQKENQVLDNDRSGFAARCAPFNAAINSYSAIESLRANYKVRDAWAKWQREHQRDGLDIESDKNFIALRDYALAQNDTYEKVFGTIVERYSPPRIIYNNHLAASIRESWLAEGERESCLDLVVRSFVGHHIDLLEKTTILASPDESNGQL